ncbi:DUF455 family protein [Paenibacillus montanisoli]|uniref:DUF455 domain-containing protein n=1 Tax=Paenibacillus montanisoli TaxID=2081970 RepID=A0A328U4Q7_9BACL|nr:DUF455 family protein [Paenibacillus montanisoli]RAP75905.1 hypothetical protein DL346_10770 [Paenibacillus montanisoli]
MNDRRNKTIITHQRGRFLSPEDTAKRLTELFWEEFELSRAAFGWLPAMEDFETKGALSRFGYLHNGHAKLLSERVAELPGPSLERQLSPVHVREAYERAFSAPSEAAFFQGYAVVLGKLYETYDRLQYRLDPILDAPTLDTLRYILKDRMEMLRYANDKTFFAGADDPLLAEQLIVWRSYVEQLWNALEAAAKSGTPGAVEWPAIPNYETAGPLPSVSAWDEERFPIYEFNDAYKTSYSDPSMSPLNDSIKQMHYINATEMGAAETLCYLYYGVQQMPLTFYFDLARHLWDEVRHCQMGVRRLQQLGYKTSQFKYFKGSPGRGLQDLAAEWFPDMYAGLTMVAEPCSFIKKRKSAAGFREYGDELSAIQCEFDMADERMHVDFGKKWGPELYKQINHLITAAEMSERARLRRIEQLGAAATEEEAKEIARNFPGFCGLSTTELNYGKY